MLRRPPAAILVVLASLGTLSACSSESGDDRNVEAVDAGDTGGTDVADDAPPTLGDVAIAACEGEDRLAPNHDIARATRTTDGVFAEPALFLCPGSRDVFAVEARSGQRIEATIASSRLGTRLALALLPPGAEDVEDAVAQTDGSAGAEPITFDVVAAGDHHLVAFSSGGETGPYEIEVTRSCTSDADCTDVAVCSLAERRCVTPGDTCGSDRLEPNDGVESAAPAEFAGDGFAFLHGLSVCADDRDAFAVELTEPSDLSGELEFDPGDDLDLQVFGPRGGMLVPASTEPVNPEIFSLELLPPGTYLVVVTANAAVGEPAAAYNLTLRRQAARCASDVDCRAPGRSVCDAGACIPFVVEAAGGPGSACDSASDCEEDLVCFSASPGLSGNVCTFPCDGDGDCSVLAGGYCFDFGRDEFCLPECTTDSECPTWYACGGGGRCAPIECGVDADCDAPRVCRRTERQGVGTCTDAPFPACRQDDDNEPNDTDGQATPVAVGTTDDLLICGVNDDFFTFTIAEDASTLEVSVAFDGDADLDVFIYDDRGRIVGQGLTPEDNPERARARLLSAGTYRIRVNQVATAIDVVTAYSLTVTVTDESCAEDADACLSLDPLRVECASGTGACAFIEGDGTVPLGGQCDSSDDCVPEAHFCWTFESATARRNVCTHQCEVEADCDDVPGTECRIFDRGFGACLPG
jgi:hypothetical protein